MHFTKHELDLKFIEGFEWPIDPASLAALTDLGLSNSQIAHYFHVEAKDVDRLRDAFGRGHSA